MLFKRGIKKVVKCLNDVFILKPLSAFHGPGKSTHRRLTEKAVGYLKYYRRVIKQVPQ